MLDRPIAFYQSPEKHLKIQHEWALDENQNLLHIRSISSIRPFKKQNNFFMCPECKDTMIPIQGNKLNHHFRHKSEPCTYQTYLHTSAITRMLQVINNKMLSSIQYRCKACKTLETYTIPSNITLTIKEYSNEQLQKHRIDVMALNANMKPILGIEMYNTHAVDRNKGKILYNIDIPIFEIRVETILQKPENTWIATNYWNILHHKCHQNTKIFRSSRSISLSSIPLAFQTQIKFDFIEQEFIIRIIARYLPNSRYAAKDISWQISYNSKKYSLFIDPANLEPPMMVLFTRNHSYFHSRFIPNGLRMYHCFAPFEKVKMGDPIILSSIHSPRSTYIIQSRNDFHQWIQKEIFALQQWEMTQQTKKIKDLKAENKKLFKWL